MGVKVALEEECVEEEVSEDETGWCLGDSPGGRGRWGPHSCRHRRRRRRRRRRRPAWAATATQSSRPTMNPPTCPVGPTMWPPTPPPSPPACLARRLATWPALAPLAASPGPSFAACRLAPGDTPRAAAPMASRAAAASGACVRRDRARCAGRGAYQVRCSRKCRTCLWPPCRAVLGPASHGTLESAHRRRCYPPAPTCPSWSCNPPSAQGTRDRLRPVAAKAAARR